MERKRLTLTGNKIPEHIYRKLEALGNQRKLTPYIVGLIEKEEMMGTFIQHLSVLINKVDSVEQALNDLNQKIENVSIQPSLPAFKNYASEMIQEGKLEMLERIEGGIEEVIEESDY